VARPLRCRCGRPWHNFAPHHWIQGCCGAVLCHVGGTMCGGCNEGLIYGLVRWRCPMWRMSNLQGAVFIACSRRSRADAVLIVARHRRPSKFLLRLHHCFHTSYETNLVEPLFSFNGHRVFVSSLRTNPNPKIEGYLNMAVGNATVTFACFERC
jgi:hypothetical protein